MKKLLATVLGLGMTFGLVGVAATAGATPEPKVVVCKYVSTPGGVLDHIIIVSANALEGFNPNAAFPQSFEDAQDSLAVRYAEEGEQAQDVPLSDCPGGGTETETPPPPVDYCGTLEGVQAEDEDCPEPTPTGSPSPTPTQPPVGGPGPKACPGSVSFGPWYGDPRTNITLTGEGTFVVKGGIQRFSGQRVITVALACDATFKVNRYKVKEGKAVTVYLNGVLIATRVAPKV
jgi:hypothetical protein